jgi:hypothetical protein
MSTLVMTMVRVGSGNPLDVGKWYSIPFSKGQPKGLGHSIGPHKQVLWKVFNSEKAKAGIRSMGVEENLQDDLIQPWPHP